MDYLRQGIHLRGYAQKNPSRNTSARPSRCSSVMLDASAGVVSTSRACRCAPSRCRPSCPRSVPTASSSCTRSSGVSATSAGGAAEPRGPTERPQTFVRGERKVGRNEPCPAGRARNTSTATAGSTEVAPIRAAMRIAPWTALLPAKRETADGRSASRRDGRRPRGAHDLPTGDVSNDNHIPSIRGLRLGCTAAGIRYQGRNDLVAIALPPGSTCTPCSPVTLLRGARRCRARAPGLHGAALPRHQLRNANAGTGDPGLAAARRAADWSRPRRAAARNRSCRSRQA